MSFWMWPILGKGQFAFISIALQITELYYYSLDTALAALNSINMSLQKLHVFLFVGFLHYIPRKKVPSLLSRYVKGTSVTWNVSNLGTTGTLRLLVRMNRHRDEYALRSKLGPGDTKWAEILTNEEARWRLACTRWVGKSPGFRAFLLPDQGLHTSRYGSCTSPNIHLAVGG